MGNGLKLAIIELRKQYIIICELQNLWLELLKLNLNLNNQN